MYLAALQTDTVLLMGLAVVFVLVVVLVAFRHEVRNVVNRQLTSVRLSEDKLLEVTTAISAELQLQKLLAKVMDTISDILDAERSTLFLHDPDTHELFSHVAQGLDSREIRFPDDSGIAGDVFTSGAPVNIRDAYADSRFNREVDRKTGFRTRSILCMPITSKAGRRVGVVQVLNKREGVFEALDERRVAAFGAQIAVAIENAQLFEEVQRIKNYNEAILQSMTAGVVSLDAEGQVTKLNAAAQRLLNADAEAWVGEPLRQRLSEANHWLADSVDQVLQTGVPVETRGAHLLLLADQGEATAAIASVNAAVQPLEGAEGEAMGALVLLEDITSEKRIRDTMARYMTKEIADKLLEDGAEVLGGTLQTATILFSDIRAFTALSERIGPTATVALLNEYFTLMVDLVLEHGGILDKYIGDAIMAVYGAPFSTVHDADNALRTAIAMQRALADFNAEQTRQGRERIDVGIGLSTGEVVSGNIGSSRRMDYTVIGDGVNLASRLEGATKTYGVRVLLSQLTVDQLLADHALRELDLVRVKGKEQPVAVYEALDAWAPDEFEHRDAVLARYARGLDHYRNRSFADAAESFRLAMELRPADKPSRIFLERALHFAQHPPPDDWNGVWSMREK